MARHFNCQIKEGSDILIGGSGNDTMYGEQGNDCWYGCWRRYAP
ncbi:hypothetical protein [Endozoicomonas acroporae]